MVPATVGAGSAVGAGVDTADGDVVDDELDVVVFEPPQAANVSTVTATSSKSTPATMMRALRVP
jgi:hypothetical protein